MNYVMKGNIIYPKEDMTAMNKEHSYLVCEQDSVAGVFDTLPKQYGDYPVYDHEDQIIIPGMTDLHVHAPQYPFRGHGMDLELPESLRTHAFLAESKYRDLHYAKKACIPM